MVSNSMKRLDEIFNICYGSQLDLNKCEICGKDQGFNFVNRSNSNCGVSARIQKVDKKEPFKAGSITVAMGGSVLSSFVQQEDFYTGQNVKVLVPIEEMGLAEKLFYCQCIEANRYRFSTFGREANYTFDSLLVPAREDIPSNVGIKQIGDPFDKRPILSKEIKLEVEKWQWFELGNIFDIKKGKRLTKADMEKGDIPYIGAIDSNNGVSAMIANNEHIHKGNTVSVSYNGSIAEAFYQKNPFWATDDVNVFYSEKINCYTALFLTTIIHREKYRFNYGRKWDLDIMKKSKIKLPAINTGEKDEFGKPIYEPDWQFMEDYIKSLPYSACI